MEESAKANVDFIHAAYGFGEIKNVKYKVDNLSELPKVVSKIFENK